VRGAHEPDPRNAQASWQREPESVTEIGEEFIDVGAVGAPAPLDDPPANDPLPEPAPEREDTSLAPPERAEAPPKLRPETPAAPRPVPEGEDWLRVEDQLEPRTATTAERASEPARDLLVERLLEAERRKQERRQRNESAPVTTETSRDRVPPSVPPRRDDIVSDAPQDLADRFTRAVTEAEKHNPAWSNLPLGRVGSVRVRLSLEDGVLREPDFEGTPPTLLRRLVEKTVFLLRRGNFALPFSVSRAGEHWFLVEVRLSQVDDVNRYAYERPTRTRPGRAYFVLPSGRLFEAFVDPNVGPP
jgi:hypothetical protein